jgi:hypothetical protein
MCPEQMPFLGKFLVAAATLEDSEQSLALCEQALCCLADDMGHLHLQLRLAHQMQAGL